jgi:hypothetical protein
MSERLRYLAWVAHSPQFGSVAAAKAIKRQFSLPTEYWIVDF